jgi:hypothetical protein
VGDLEDGYGYGFGLYYVRQLNFRGKHRRQMGKGTMVTSRLVVR